MNKVIAPSNLPAGLPIRGTILLWLLMDRFNPSGIVIGIVWTLWVIVFLCMAVSWWKQETVDITRLLKQY